MTLSEVRTVLAGMNFHPSRAMGQNFLVDGNILGILLEAADVSGRDIVLEIGPGLGTVTEALLNRARHVTAVEKDRRLFAYLSQRFERRRRLQLIGADFLDLEAAAVLRGESPAPDPETLVHAGRTPPAGPITKLVSNLPYSSGSRILIELAMADPAPTMMVVTVQREVAERLVSPAGGREYGKLSVWMQLDYEIELVKTVSPTCFWPVPEVRSEIVRMIRRPLPRLSESERRWFLALTTEAFSHRRKQLGSILLRSQWMFSPREVGEILAGGCLSPQVRPEEIPVDGWCALARRTGELRRVS